VTAKRAAVYFDPDIHRALRLKAAASDDSMIGHRQSGRPRAIRSTALAPAVIALAFLAGSAFEDVRLTQLDSRRLIATSRTIPRASADLMTIKRGGQESSGVIRESLRSVILKV